MTLATLKRGQKAKITEIIHPTLRIEALRFGIGVGQKIECTEIIPQGPVIIKKGNQQIAVGRELANSISINIL